jgi:hypothetical protein
VLWGEGQQKKCGEPWVVHIPSALLTYGHSGGSGDGNITYDQFQNAG